MQTDILSALGGTDTPQEPVTLPAYQSASHGTADRLFQPVRTMPGQLAIDTDTPAPVRRCRFGRAHLWVDGLVDGVYTPDLYTCAVCGAVSDER